MSRLRRRNGQFRRNILANHIGLLIMLVTLLAGLFFQSQKPEERELISPIPRALTSTVVHAQEIEATPTPEPTLAPKSNLSEKEQILNYIEEVFGDKAEEAKIVSHCESKWNPQAVGDTNLMVNYQGEIVGDSIGVFQIRTGGRDFNRAKANGMTADEFRIYLKDWKNNVDYAKTIYDRQGWFPWTCKKDLK